MFFSTCKISKKFEYNKNSRVLKTNFELIVDYKLNYKSISIITMLKEVTNQLQRVEQVKITGLFFFSTVQNFPLQNKKVKVDVS